MEKKLDFFYIGESYGGNQDWCFDHMMQLGGCGAITACDSSIYLALHHGKKSLYSGNLEIRSGTPKELNEMLDHNQIDLAYYIDQKVYGQNWEKTLEEPESVVFVASTDAKLPKKEEYLLAELLNQPFFLTEKDSNYRYALEQELASRHLGIRPFFETRNPDVIIELIKENQALSFLPRYAVEESLNNGSLRLLKVQDFEMQMYRQLFYHKDKWITEEMKNFIALGELSML